MRIRIPPGVRQQIESAILGQPSADASHRLRRLLDSAFRQIELFPESGRKHNRHREDMRVVLVGDYRLLYLVDVEADEVILVSFVFAGLPGDALD
ncbi:type II toxin-antitoxin system RelE/ParE family toxin [Meiothermus ruber]|uniref:type II toxin-antitoxin system RelE/ParE family toxin n=1 Tax=Meiothermus ruber TaxID=277 RepID=UPI001364DAF6|nr:type II toxin-antitoxin system RelE/ParE family toxin [Meiothermus ruber]